MYNNNNAQNLELGNIVFAHGVCQRARSREFHQLPEHKCFACLVGLGGIFKTDQ
jgi:hypothetical protein